MKVFIVNGSPCAGKTTFEEFVRAVAHKNDEIIRINSMITIVKDFAKTHLSWNEEKDEKSRLMLSRLKDLLDDWNDSPYNYISEFIKNCEKGKFTSAVFIDAREPKDIERLKKDFNATSILIDRGEKKVYNNHADNNVYKTDYDIVIFNNGTIEELKEKAEKFYHIEIKLNN